MFGRIGNPSYGQVLKLPTRRQNATHVAECYVGSGASVGGYKLALSAASCPNAESLMQLRFQDQTDLKFFRRGTKRA
jgi:hypothetical protein